LRFTAPSVGLRAPSFANAFTRWRELTEAEALGDPAVAEPGPDGLQELGFLFADTSPSPTLRRRRAHVPRSSWRANRTSSWSARGEVTTAATV